MGQPIIPLFEYEWTVPHRNDIEGEVAGEEKKRKEDELESRQTILNTQSSLTFMGKEWKKGSLCSMLLTVNDRAAQKLSAEK